MRPAGRTYILFKRMVDLTAALVGVVALGPLLVGCAVWIRLVDGGPALYSQWRVGRDGRLFRIFKFRTMTQGAEAPGSAQYAQADDRRIIRGGAWMRKSHIDELPQLWNILNGEMSLVGPRPERPEMFEQLRQSMPRFDRRLTAMPGLTGLAQIRNGYTNDAAGARRKLAYDLRYMRKQSVVEEIRIVLATIPRIWDQAAL